MRLFSKSKKTPLQEKAEKLVGKQVCISLDPARIRETFDVTVTGTVIHCTDNSVNLEMNPTLACIDSIIYYSWIKDIWEAPDVSALNLVPGTPLDIQYAKGGYAYKYPTPTTIQAVYVSETANRLIVRTINNPTFHIDKYRIVSISVRQSSTPEYYYEKLGIKL